MATFLMIFNEKQLPKFHPLPNWSDLKLHSLTFKDAQINFNDT